MSSIRVSGNTSGYYDLTVPDVAGQNTIPLDQLVTTDVNGSITLSSTTSSPSLQIERNDSSGNVAQAGFNVFGSSTNIQPRLAVGVGPAGSPPSADFFFTEDGKLGIGTSNPQEKLHIQDGKLLANVNSNYQQGSLGTHLLRSGSFDPAITNNSTAIKIFPAAGNTGRDVGDYHSGIGFNHLDPDYSTWGTSYPGTHAWIGSKVESTSAAELSSLVFATNSSITAGTFPTERMKIDPNGYVTTPYQPAFRAYLSTEWSTINAYVNSGWTNQYNRGNCFNQGTFTAPVDGVYNFTVAWDALSTQSQLNLDRNGSYAGGFRYEPTGRTDNSWETHSYSVQTQLNANDYVKLYLDGGGGSNPIHMGGNQWGFFAGYLVG